MFAPHPTAPVTTGEALGAGLVGVRRSVGTQGYGGKAGLGWESRVVVGKQGWGEKQVNGEKHWLVKTRKKGKIESMEGSTGNTQQGVLMMTHNTQTVYMVIACFHNSHNTHTHTTAPTHIPLKAFCGILGCCTRVVRGATVERVQLFLHTSYSRPPLR